MSGDGIELQVGKATDNIEKDGETKAPYEVKDSLVPEMKEDKNHDQGAKIGKCLLEQNKYLMSEQLRLSSELAKNLKVAISYSQ